jgi:hypothetical protein
MAGIATKRLLLLRNLCLDRTMEVHRTWWWTSLKINVTVSHLFL